MLKVSMFEMPNNHPFGMLEGYHNAYEKEMLLSVMLVKNIDNNSFMPIVLEYDHPELVEDGLLLQTGNREYALTEKAKGLLYSVYYKR